MVAWIVLVKTTEGTQTIPLEADFVENSDDGKEVQFASLGPAVEALEVFENVRPELTRDQSLAEFKKFVRMLSKISVASFKSEVVLGYYQPGDFQAA